MMDSHEAKAPETLSEEALDQASGGLLPASPVVGQARLDVSAGAGPHVKAADGSVKPGDAKAYEAWPC